MEGALPFTGFVLAAVMAGVAFLCWRKAMSYHVLLVESSHRFDALRHKLRKFEKDYTKITEQLADIKQQTEKQLKDAQGSITDWEQKYQQISSSYDEVREQNSQRELKVDHLSKQVDVMTAQLKEADAMKRELQDKVSYAQKAESQESKNAKAKLLDEVKEWRGKYRVLESEVKKTHVSYERLKKEAGKVGLDQLQANKRKLSHYKHLYQSMRGLREMADERNNNWELALKKLSTWVLKKHDKKADYSSAPIGSLVGGALEKIGDGLIADEFSRKGATVKSVSNAEQVDSAGQ